MFKVQNCHLKQNGRERYRTLSNNNLITFRFKLVEITSKLKKINKYKLKGFNLKPFIREKIKFKICEKLIDK